jgi:hypothetical protein
MKKLLAIQFALALIFAYQPFPQAIIGGTSKIGGVSAIGGGPSGGDTIAFDGVSSTSGTNEDKSSSYSWSHTVTSNADGILCVGVSIVDTNSAAIVSGITWNTSQNLSNINSRPTGTGWSANSNRVEQWCVLAPTTGTHSIAVTLAAGPAQTSLAGAISLTGVHQSLTVDAINGASSATGQPNGTILTVAANDWVLDVIVDNSGDTMFATAPSTLRWSFLDSNPRASGGSTQGPKVSPGTVTMAWTGLNDAWSQSLIALKPGP